MFREEQELGGSFESFKIQIQAKGFAIVEVLLAFLILSSGLLAILNFYILVQKSNSQVKSQAEAMMAAEGKMHEQESFLGIDDPRLDDGYFTDSVDGIAVKFERNWSVVSDTANPAKKSVRVSLKWKDNSEQDHWLALESDIYLTELARGIEGLLKVRYQAKQSLHQSGWGVGN